MSCYSCGTSGKHQTWCVEAKQPIVIPVLPVDAVIPHFQKQYSGEELARAMKEPAVVPEKYFVTKDSGQREQFESGMVRDVEVDKPRYDLIGWGWKLIKRWAELVGRGAIKYGELNFEKASTETELKRFKSSAMRHMVQWAMGETDEDHAAAVCFNLAGYEAVKEKLRENQDRRM